MKKIAIILLGILLITSCKKDFFSTDEWGGTYDYAEMAGCDYMLCVADNLIVDNLKQMETALFIESQGSTSSTRFVFNGSIWTVGNEWKVSDKSSLLPGMSIKRVAADSTWTLSRKGKYSFSGYDFDTDYEMDIRMHPDTSGRATGDHFWWDVTLKKCNRTEDKGYRSEITTPAGSVLEYSYGTMGRWAYCYGVLGMKVYKDDELIDVARLQINGGRYNDLSYLHNL